MSMSNSLHLPENLIHTVDDDMLLDEAWRNVEQTLQLQHDHEHERDSPKELLQESHTIQQKDDYIAILEQENSELEDVVQHLRVLATEYRSKYLEASEALHKHQLLSQSKSGPVAIADNTSDSSDNRCAQIVEELQQQHKTELENLKDLITIKHNEELKHALEYKLKHASLLVKVEDFETHLETERMKIRYLHRVVDASVGLLMKYELQEASLAEQMARLAEQLIEAGIPIHKHANANHDNNNNNNNESSLNSLSIDPRSAAYQRARKLIEEAARAAMTPKLNSPVASGSNTPNSIIAPRSRSSVSGTPSTASTPGSPHQARVRLTHEKSLP